MKAFALSHISLTGGSLEPVELSQALALSQEGICLEPPVLDEGAMPSVRRTQFDARHLNCTMGFCRHRRQSASVSYSCRVFNTGCSHVLNILSCTKLSLGHGCHDLWPTMLLPRIAQSFNLHLLCSAIAPVAVQPVLP